MRNFRLRERTLIAVLAAFALPLSAQEPRPSAATRDAGTRSGQSRSADQPGTASRPGSRPAGGRGPVQCEKCHADRQFLVGKARSGQGDSALFVPDTLLRDSRHRTLVCADCHAGYNDGYPHAQVRAVAVPCQDCHADQGSAWNTSIHAQNFGARGDAPTCVSCHSSHRVLGANDERSPTYPLNVAQLCGSCHNSKKILDAYFERPRDSTARTAVGDYKRSVHGLAMTKAGLVVSATCSDCHDAHRVLPRDSAGSTIGRAQVAATCGACHAGVLAAFDSSAHGQALISGDTTTSGHAAPVCVDCHGGHTVVAADDPTWFSGVVGECGTCHARLLETYFETYHGKATRLGYGLAAKCSDCHTAHAMLPATDSLSTVHPTRLVETCGQCHENASANFVKYKPHGDPRDREKNPEMYWVWLLMTTLLVSVLAFFGAHTVLWLTRLAIERRRGGDPQTPAAPPASPAPEVDAPAPPAAGGDASVGEAERSSESPPPAQESPNPPTGGAP